MGVRCGAGRVSRALFSRASRGSGPPGMLPGFNSTALSPVLLLFFFFSISGECEAAVVRYTSVDRFWFILFDGPVKSVLLIRIGGARSIGMGVGGVSGELCAS